MKTSWKSWMSAVAVSLVVAAAMVACKKDEPPPPLPSATAPPPAPTPTQLTIDETPLPDAGVDAGPTKPRGTGSSASLTKCCTALQQNAQSAPPQNQQAMLAAAGICNALAAQGKERNSIVAAIQGALKGANMPAACR